MYDDDDPWDDDDADEQWVEDDGDDQDDLLACPSCGQAVHEDTQQCPFCGDWITPVYPHQTGKRLIWLIAVVLVIAAMILMVIR